MYKIEYTSQAISEVKYLKKTDTAAYKKLQSLLHELIDHPYTGTGKPEMMKYEYTGYYSRRITQKHRLIYQVNEDVVTVFILSILGHYEDK